MMLGMGEELYKDDIYLEIPKKASMVKPALNAKGHVYRKTTCL